VGRATVGSLPVHMGALAKIRRSNLAQPHRSRAVIQAIGNIDRGASRRRHRQRPSVRAWQDDNSRISSAATILYLSQAAHHFPSRSKADARHRLAQSRVFQLIGMSSVWTARLSRSLHHAVFRFQGGGRRIRRHFLSAWVCSYRRQSSRCSCKSNGGKFLCFSGLLQACLQGHSGPPRRAGSQMIQAASDIFPRLYAGSKAPASILRPDAE